MTVVNDKTEYVLTWETTLRHSVTITRQEIIDQLGYLPEQLAKPPIVDSNLYNNARTEDAAYALDLIETADSLLSVEERRIVIVELA